VVILFMDIGSKIKAARMAKGMTQEELGKHLGVQKSAIAKYESGRVVNIKRSTLKKISDILDIRPSELIFEEQKQPIKDELSTVQKELLNYVRNMSEEQAEGLLALLKGTFGK
jgi:transcriptional regulator with XRE-family HTH domain